MAVDQLTYNQANADAFAGMTTSLAHSGEGLGTLGLPEVKLRELCRVAGFSEVERIALENPFNTLYLATP